MTLSAHLPSQSSDSSGVLKVLSNEDAPDLYNLLNREPDAYCVVAERINAGVLNSPAGTGQTWGWFRGGHLESALYVGANLIPVETTPAARNAFADKMMRVGRRSSAIVGHRDEVLDFWERVSVEWGPARDIRGDQPLMLLDSPPLAPADQSVRLVTPSELDILMPASVAMFEEEVGVSPVSGGREASYRARLGYMIREGRAYARIQNGEVLFKAEVGAVSARACQIQGVWVAPRLRNTGMAAPGVAAVVTAAMRDHAPRVSLYANRHNVAALRSYDRVGFREIGVFSTILF